MELGTCCLILALRRQAGDSSQVRGQSDGGHRVPGQPELQSETASKSKAKQGAGETPQQLGVLVVLAEEPGLVPSTHTVVPRHLELQLLGIQSLLLMSLGTDTLEPRHACRHIGA